MEQPQTRDAQDFWVIALAVAGVLFICALLVHFGVPRLSVGTVAWSRDFVALAGTLLAVLGFPIALAQLRRTQRSAEAARLAVNSARDSWAKYDVRNELSKSLTHARVALEHVSNGKWDSAVNSLVEFNLSLSRISALARGVSSEDMETLRNEMAELVALIDGFEGASASGPTTRLIQRAKSRLRKQLGVLTEIEIRFQEAIQ